MSTLDFVTGFALPCLGLLLEISGALLLAFGIFRPEKKIRELSDVPIEPNESSFMSVADPTPNIQRWKIAHYRDLLVHNYLNERRLGRLGFIILASGVLLQFAGYIIAFIYR